jgi:hypothetical protein
VAILLNLAGPWMAIVIGVELDNTVKQTAQVALTSFCGSRITDTTAMPIVLFLTRYQGDLMWQEHLEAISNPMGLNFHVGMYVMAEYAQYSFDMQHTTARIVIQ